MRVLAASALVLLLASGCVGKAVNQATIYTPVSGVIEMDVKIPSGESVTKVQFQVNDKVVGEDDGSSGTGVYSAQVDTTGLPSDTLAKLAAVGVRPDGSQVVLRENYILVEQDDTTGTDENGDPLPIASDDGSNNGDIVPATSPTPTTAAASPASGAATTAYKKLPSTTSRALKPVKLPTKIHL